MSYKLYFNNIDCHTDDKKHETSIIVFKMKWNRIEDRHHVISCIFNKSSCLLYLRCKHHHGPGADPCSAELQRDSFYQREPSVMKTLQKRRTPTPSRLSARRGNEQISHSGNNAITFCTYAKCHADLYPRVYVSISQMHLHKNNSNSLGLYTVHTYIQIYIAL